MIILNEDSGTFIQRMDFRSSHSPSDSDENRPMTRGKATIGEEDRDRNSLAEGLHINGQIKSKAKDNKMFWGTCVGGWNMPVR